MGARMRRQHAPDCDDLRAGRSTCTLAEDGQEVELRPRGFTALGWAALEADRPAIGLLRRGPASAGLLSMYP